jgi:DNA-binding NtrC family response regulator
MIRVGVLSRDVMLAPALSSVLSPEFLVFEEPYPEHFNGERSSARFDVLILDFDSSCCPSDEWLSFFDSIKSHYATPVIVMANDESRVQALDLVERGAHGYVRKPPVVRELKVLIRSACETRLLKGELETARRQLENLAGLDQLTGSSAPMQVVYRLISKVANLEASVLINGESGTGKELIARAIHNVGSRSRRPFVAVSCGAIPETLIEAELFGHEKGAFTGTLGTREGYFESAGDGTLFLDEIGELKPNIKLLRVLQQREFNRLGSNRSIPLRARVVLATHRDLEKMVATGEFRQDLFYRVNVMNISAPALRHRSQDIPLLAQHFLRHYSQLYRKTVDSIEPEALALLRTYSWPGNVRELENAMQRAIIMAERDSIQTVDLPDTIQDLESELPDMDDELPAGSFERMLRHYKIKIANEAIQLCNGNKTLAAQSLSISRAYLHRLIRPLPANTESNIHEISSSPARVASAGR